MPPQVYDYVLQGTASPLVDVYAPLLAVKSITVGAAAVLFGASLLAAAAYRDARGRQVPALARRPLLVSSFMLWAMYTLTWGNVDEVSINLEHAYNLYHFGKFSFSPVRMIGGTVEYAYYLLLAPFGSTPTSLMTANFVLGWLLAWSHLWLLSRWGRQARPATQLGLLLLFAVYYPVVATLSSGFGNGLVSLAFLGSLSLHFAGRSRLALVVACALPLLRPDAVLYSYALVFAFLTTSRGWFAPTRLHWWVWPVCALAAYLTLFRLLFGQWIPTPIAFKSVYPSMVSLPAVRSAADSVLTEMTSLVQLPAWLAVLASFRFKHDPRVAVVRRLLLPMTGVFLFYSLTRSVLGDFSGDAYQRYWIGFSLALFLCVFLVLLLAAPLLEARRSYTAVFGLAVPAAVIALAASAVTWDATQSRYRHRSFLGYAGQVAATILPPELSVATTELNTFGLMLDREVGDLWGYTNPAIARARTLNGGRVRNNPSAFLEMRPDIFFAYLEPAGRLDAERYLATFHHLGKNYNLLGDMHRVLAEYDVMFVTHPQRRLCFLVRRERVAVVRASLEQHGYAEKGQRELDLARFGQFYDRQRLVQSRF
jgi:hypothetical protein